MKRTLLSLTLALMAILTFSSCSNSDEEYPAPQESFFIGNWQQDAPKPDNIVDGYTRYSFQENGKLKVGVFDFFDVGKLVEYEGNWSLEKKTLTIEYDTPDGLKRIRLVDIKFNEQKHYFSAREADSRQEYHIYKEYMYKETEKSAQ